MLIKFILKRNVKEQPWLWTMQCMVYIKVPFQPYFKSKKIDEPIVDDKNKGEAKTETVSNNVWKMQYWIDVGS